MVDYALPTKVKRVGMDTLNKMVGSDAYLSYFSPQSYQIYSTMVKNECKQYPNIRESPWDPTLITSNTTTPIPNDSLTGPPPDANRKEVPAKKNPRESVSRKAHRRPS
ncbi:MAG: hypothetical protein Q9224_004001 [Gallowayella concinna]